MEPLGAMEPVAAGLAASPTPAGTRAAPVWRIAEPVDAGQVVWIGAGRPRCRGFSHPKGLASLNGVPSPRVYAFAARKRAQGALRQRPQERSDAGSH